MKSSTLKRVILCVLLFIIGGIWWYFLANHQFHKWAIEERIPLLRYGHHLRDKQKNPFEELRHQEEQMEKEFRNMEKEFKNFDDEIDFEDIEDIKWDQNAKWAFKYYSSTNNNWEESSYNVNWERSDWAEWGTIKINWTNKDWKDFSYSWEIHDWKTEWVLIDEDWNTKEINLDGIDIKEIYNESNNISE